MPGATTAGGAASAAPRRPPRSASENPQGGWTRDADGNLKPPSKAEPEPTSSTSSTSSKPGTSSSTSSSPPAGGFMSGLKDGAKQGRNMKARNVNGSGQKIVGPVRAPGTPGGIMLAIITYPVFVAWLKGGNPAVTAWFKAKFLNDAGMLTQIGEREAVTPTQGSQGKSGFGTTKDKQTGKTIPRGAAGRGAGGGGGAGW